MLQLFKIDLYPFQDQNGREGSSDAPDKSAASKQEPFSNLESN